MDHYVGSSESVADRLSKTYRLCIGYSKSARSFPNLGNSATAFACAPHLAFECRPENPIAKHSIAKRPQLNLAHLSSNAAQHPNSANLHRAVSLITETGQVCCSRIAIHN
jgi:hypothetical protein